MLWNVLKLHKSKIFKQPRNAFLCWCKVSPKVRHVGGNFLKMCGEVPFVDIVFSNVAADRVSVSA